MPYIKKDIREEFEDVLKQVEDAYFDSPGELNYLISMICQKYQDGDISYSKINEIIGILECVKQEYYRRIAVPYEDNKLKENGDVY